MSVRRLDPIQPESFAFSAENLAWAKKTIGKYPNGKQASAVIPLLWRAQEQNEGWVSRPAIEYVAALLDMSYIRVLEVATFYTMFQLSPVGRKAHIQVCGTTPCMLRGAEELKKVCQRKIHPEPHHVTADGNLSWEEVECLGACVNAPMVQVFKDTYEDLTPEILEKLIDDLAANKPAKPGPQIARQYSAPEGGPTTLTDKKLYDGKRQFARLEPTPPPQPPAHPPAAVPPATPSPAANTPKPEDIRPVTLAAKVTESAKAEAERKEQASPQPGTVESEKSQAETGIVRTTTHRVEKATTTTPIESGAPELLKKPRHGAKPDDLKLIWGVGPKLEKLLNKMGFWHFDQIAGWTAKELKWVDERLEGFKGRASRDEWVKQAKKLATGWRPESAIGEKPKKK